MTEEAPRLRFLICGTPRSGTTLVQRLANELSDVEVPYESHFFRLGTMFARPRAFPMRGAALLEALSKYSSLAELHGAGLVPARVWERLDGVADNPFQIFECVVAELAATNAKVLGEKTPSHLRSWQSLHRAFPDLAFVFVVRDPRGVLASHLQLREWGLSSPQALATTWVADQLHVLGAQRTLDPSRFLLLRYEDVVVDPDRARAALAQLIDLLPVSDATASGPPPNVYLPREHAWKARSVLPVDPSRARAWESELSIAQQQVLVTICGQEMLRLGYAVTPPDVGWSQRLTRVARRARARQLTATRDVRARLLASRTLGFRGTWS